MTDNRMILVEFSPSGGLFQFATQLGGALTERGEHVELWTGPRPEIDSAEAGFTVRSVLPTWHPNDTADLGHPLATIRRAVRAGRLVLAWLVLAYHLRRRPPRAVLYSQWRFTFEPWFVVFIGRLLPHTIFGILAHEPLPRSDAKDTSTPKEGRLLRASFAAAWGEMDTAFVLGPQTRKLVLEHWHPRCDVHVVPHGDSGALWRRREPMPVQRTEPVALFFGTWTTYKGIHVLIDAFGLVRARMPSARLILAGAIGADVDGDELLRRAAETGNVDARPGYCDIEDVPDLVESARVVVTPYVRASQSGVAHLAYTFGRPVVGTTVGDLADTIVDGVTGFLVPPGDPAALAAAMLELLHDPDLSSAFGQAGRVAIERSWAIAASTISTAVEAAARQLSSED